MAIRLWRSGVGRWIVGISFLFAQAAGAAEWSIEPSMSLSGEYDDNPQLAQTREKVLGADFSPGLRLNGLTERLEARANLSLRLSRYFSHQDLNANDQYYNTSVRYMTERNSVELNTSFTRDLTLQSELAETGLALVRKRRDLFTLNPKWSDSLTERMTLQVEYTFSRANYADRALIDYRTDLGSAQLSYQLTERDQATFSTYYFFYQPATDFRSHEVGAKAGLAHRFSETFRSNITVGGRSTLSSVPTPAGEARDRNNGWVAEGNLEKEFESGSLRGGLDRETRPSGAGYLLQVDHLFLSMSHTVAENLTAGLNLDFYRSQALQVNQPIPDSRYYRVEQRWDWRWAEHWTAGVSYRYARQAYSSLASSATSNAVYLTLTYTGPKMAISR